MLVLWECNMNKEHWIMITAAWDFQMTIISEYVLVSDYVFEPATYLGLFKFKNSLIVTD